MSPKLLQYLDFVAPIEPIAPTEDITVDKWYRQTGRPLFRAGRAVDVGISVVDAELLTQAEGPQLDKWEPHYPRTILYHVDKTVGY